MNGGDDRLMRLKDLVERLERLPASPERDRVLGEVRARAVDVDTGEQTSPMKFVDPVPPAPGSQLPRTPAPAPMRSSFAVPAPRAGGPRQAPAERVTPSAEAAAETFQLLEGVGEWLSLDDSSAPPTGEPLQARPWTLGLRG